MLKQTIRVGNSAGILLPKRYLGSLVEVKIKTPNHEEIKQQILDKLNPYLENVMGIYLAGSYARNEEKPDSDIDLVVITSEDLEIKMENYHILCLDYSKLVTEMEESIIEYYPMLLESKPILNKALLKQLLSPP